MKKVRFRTIKKDGSLNIASSKRMSFDDLYHDLLKSSWLEFTLLFTFVFVFLNCLFGLLYFLIQKSDFDGFVYSSGFEHYLESFFFSVQTFGTIGYGKISPVGVLANAVVTLESYVSLFIVAVLTGIIFARFAKPSAKVLFSRNAVIRSFDGIPCLMFRMANARQNFITDARVRVSLSIDDPKTGFRNFYDLKLERESSPIFALSWTIAHDIDSESPLKNLDAKDWEERNCEIIVTFSGTDTTLSQQVYAKNSYIFEEVLCDHDFVDVLRRRDDGAVELMIEKFNLVKPVLTAP